MHGKTYDHIVSEVNFFTLNAPAYFCISGVGATPTVTPTMTLSTPVHSDGSATVTFTPESFTMTALTVDVVTIASWDQDIAEPCSIDIEANVDDEVEATEGESDTWTVEGCV